MVKAKIGIGLDIGTQSVKVVEVRGGKNPRLNRFGLAPLADGVVEDGVVKQVKEVGRAIRELLAETGIRRRRVVVAVSGRSVLTRRIKLPPMEVSEVATAVKWEAESYIPFPADEVNLDFRILNKDETTGELEVLLVCAHQGLVKSHYEALRSAGLQPLAMEVQPFAVMRSLGLPRTRESGTTAILDLGAGISDLVIVEGGMPCFTRTLSVTGSLLTKGIADSAGRSLSAAEELKLTQTDALLDLDGADPNTLEYQVNQGFQGGVENLILELQRSFDYYQLEHENQEISRLVITGGGSTAHNLLPYLERELGLKTQGSFYDERLSIPLKLQDSFARFSPRLSVALGLGLREALPDEDEV